MKVLAVFVFALAVSSISGSTTSDIDNYFDILKNKLNGVKELVFQTDVLGEMRNLLFQLSSDAPQDVIPDLKRQLACTIITFYKYIQALLDTMHPEQVVDELIIVVRYVLHTAIEILPEKFPDDVQKALQAPSTGAEEAQKRVKPTVEKLIKTLQASSKC